MKETDKKSFFDLILAYVGDPTASEEARLFMIGYWAEEAIRGGKLPSVLDWPMPGDAGGYAPFLFKLMADHIENK
jgi:hypothetical protein